MNSTVKPPQSGSSYGVDDLPRISHAKGSYLWDRTGKRYLDGSGGPAVYCLGHAHPEVNEAMARQNAGIAHAYRYLFTSDAAEELVEIVTRNTGGAFPHMIFSSSGSEATENSLKIALQYFSATGRKGKRRFIARQRSWHGNTLGALSVSGFKSRRAAFEGSLLPVTFVSAANAYRLPDSVGPDGLAAFLADELEQAILDAGADTVAAFIFEPVVGAAGGVVPAPPFYAKAVQAVCRRHDVLLISDEVMCGSGRTGYWRALEEDGVVPDIMGIAKGLGGGYVPLGASLYSPEIHAALVAAHGGLLSGQTFTGHTGACAAAVAVQTVVARDGLVQRVRERGASFQAELRAELADVEAVGDVRGRGYFIGIELVADRATRAPFPPAAGLHALVGRLAFERGLIVYPCTGNVDGVAGDTVIVAPPYNASDSELDEIRTILSGAIRDAVQVARTV